MNQHPLSVQWQLWIAAFGFFMQTLDTTIINTALPAIATLVRYWWQPRLLPALSSLSQPIARQTVY